MKVQQSLLSNRLQNSTWVEPVPVGGLRDAEDVDHELAEHPAVEGSDEEHGDDEARGDVGAGRPARHPVVEEQHCQQRKVVELR